MEIKSLNLMIYNMHVKNLQNKSRQKFSDKKNSYFLEPSWDARVWADATSLDRQYCWGVFRTGPWPRDRWCQCVVEVTEHFAGTKKFTSFRNGNMYSKCLKSELEITGNQISSNQIFLHVKHPVWKCNFFTKTV